MLLISSERGFESKYSWIGWQIEAVNAQDLQISLSSENETMNLSQGLYEV